jgi:UDP-hydrolysing UDP-N-acetyl-D-glucosamine 2-epimerase
MELRKFEDIELNIIASSSSLLDKYGTSYKDVEADGFSVDHKIDCLLMNDSHEAMAKTAGFSMMLHADYLGNNKPDMLLVVGDRFDALPAALCASMMNIPIAHIQGGETSGTIDNKVRDLISKISTLHFVSTDISKNRLIRYGLNKNKIFSYGCPAVEYISKLDNGDKFDSRKIKKKFKRKIEIKPDEPYFLIIAHPDTTNEKDLNMDIVLNAVELFNQKAFVFYPNVDPNNSLIVSSIARHNKNDNFYMIRHMPLEGFVHTMAHCSCMIGNSSAGIREAASFGVPVINIGKRQNGREHNLNTIDISCEYDTIVKTIQSVNGKRLEKNNLYYHDQCSAHIAAMMRQYIQNQKKLL